MVGPSGSGTADQTSTGWTATGASSSTSSVRCDEALDDCPADLFCVEGFCQLDPAADMVVVPAGPFPMGCADANCEADEEPQHTVTLGRFAIDRFEVTVSAYDACVDDGACVAAATGNECNAGDPGYEEHPINCVDWDQATAYCEWAGKQLPTEAQWEKAARGLDSRPFPWGDEIPSCALCVMVTNGWGCGTGRTDRVGSRPIGASPYGALDMAGNVAEWVRDGYDPDYYAISPATDPPGPGSFADRTIRGGSFQSGLQVSLRAGNRTFAAPMTSSVARGFRCADE